MDKKTRRGFNPGDEREFSGDALTMLRTAAQELYWLMNRGYSPKSASALIGDHHQLSSRQRVAIMRCVSSQGDLCRRHKRLVAADSLNGCDLYIDGFNAIISLEVALSGSPVLYCMDRTIRDLAGIRGTYRIIDKTEPAVDLLIAELIGLGVNTAHFYLDAPVSNSGRLNALIAQRAEALGLHVKIQLIGDVDRALASVPMIATSDAPILDRCQSWCNLTTRIVQRMDGCWVVELSGNDSDP